MTIENSKPDRTTKVPQNSSALLSNCCLFSILEFPIVVAHLDIISAITVKYSFLNSVRRYNA